MVQALLSSIKSMLGASASQNKEFKTEAVKNNKNIFSAIKDISKIFSSQSNANAKQNASLDNIESHTLSTSAKVDRSNILLQESISLQNQMLLELKSLKTVIANPALYQQGAGGGFITRAATTAAMTLLTGGLVAGGAAGALQNLTGIGVENEGGNRSFGAGSSQNASVAMDFFKSRGWEEHQAAGIVGNLQAESGPNLNPSSVGDGGKAYGIGQWHPDRQANFQRVFGKPITQSTFQEQLEFIDWEFQNTEASAAEKLRGAGSASEAAAIIDQFYERSAGHHRQKRMDNAEALMPEGDDTGVAPVTGGQQYASLTPSDQNVEAKSSPMGSGGGNVFERQHELAGIRKLPLSDNLKNVLRQAATAAGVDVVVHSGGQAPKGSGGPRMGSTRHDHGNAADLKLYKDGKLLVDTNEEDRALMAKFVSAAVSAGATGVGAGHGYMGPDTIHVGFGKPAVWGGAPWIKSAATGVYNNQDLQAQGGAGSYGGTGTGDGSYGATGDIMSTMAGALSAFGLGGFMGGDILGMLSAFFGMPMGDTGTLAAYGVNQQGQTDNSASTSFNETEEEEPELADRRMEEAPPHATKDKKKQTATVESDYPNYEILSKEIQNSAINNSAPVVIENPVQTQPYTTPPMQIADFSTSSQNDYPLNTDPPWRPKMGVIAPARRVLNSDTGLTWASRIA